MLTDTVIKIIKAKKSELIDTPHIFEALVRRNSMLIAEIQNLIFTIILAESSIINPTFLDHNDLEAVLSEHPTEILIISLLETSSIKVLQSESIVHITIN